MKNRCMLNSTKDLNLLSVLPGLSFKRGFVKPIAENFPCCQGTGMNLGTDNWVHRCDLTRRLSGVQKLMVYLVKQWGYEYVNGLLSESLTQKEVYWLDKASKNNMKKGYSIVTNRNKASPSRFWLMALAGTWRFGIQAHIVTLKKTKADKLLPVTPVADNNVPCIVFVENIDELWKPEPLYDFEILISWCERSLIPLCCEFKTGKIENKNTALNKKVSVFSRRIDKDKNKFPLDWLERDIAGRFNYVCSASSEIKV